MPKQYRVNPSSEWSKNKDKALSALSAFLMDEDDCYDDDTLHAAGILTDLLNKSSDATEFSNYLKGYKKTHPDDYAFAENEIKYFCNRFNLTS